MAITSVLITGGAGSVGEFVSKELEGKYQVTLFDRVTADKHWSFPRELDKPFVLGDLTSLADCMRAITLARADAIVHLAAIPWNTELQAGRIDRRPIPLPEDEAMRTNVMGTYYLMDAARRLGIKKVVFASSFYVLGLGFRISDRPFQVDYLPIDEDHPQRPEDTYSLSKVMGEEIMKAFSRAYGIKTVALRLQGVDGRTVRGMEGPPSKAPMRPEARPEWRGGPQGGTWEYVDVRDVAQACRLSLEVEGLDDFEAFYISTDSLLEEDTAEVLRRTCPDLSGMAGNLKGHDLIISNKRAQEKLGYRPQHSWRSHSPTVPKVGGS